MDILATILFGVVLGFFFGLTGSGGSTLAVPILVYGLGLPPHRAVCVAMVSIGIMASVNAVQKLRQREVELRMGLGVALAGSVGAPIGAWLGRALPEGLLLTVFAGVVIVVAIRLFALGNLKLNRMNEPTRAAVRAPETAPAITDQSGSEGTRLPTLFATGFLTGLLAGLLGIGGGFVLVPALVLLCRVEIHQAVATSMFSIAVISAAAMASHWVAGQRPPAALIGLFALGGLLGMVPGSHVARRLSGPRLQRVFALVLFVLAVFILVRSANRF